MFGLVLILLTAMLGFRLLAGAMDKDRVEKYVRSKGWRLIEKNWDPFGPGWFGEKSDRIYKVLYETEEGLRYSAHVKTSLLGLSLIHI